MKVTSGNKKGRKEGEPNFSRIPSPVPRRKPEGQCNAKYPEVGNVHIPIWYGKVKGIHIRYLCRLKCKEYGNHDS